MTARVQLVVNPEAGGYSVTRVLDLREEFTSREWATAYNFPALNDGRVVKLEMPDETPSGAQGFFFNLLTI